MKSAAVGQREGHCLTRSRHGFDHQLGRDFLFFAGTRIRRDCEEHDQSHVIRTIFYFKEIHT